MLNFSGRFFAKRENMVTFALDFHESARMAESVDALVSNTSRFTPVPVRPRLRVHRGLNFSPLFFLQNRLQNQMNPIPKI